MIVGLTTWAEGSYDDGSLDFFWDYPTYLRPQPGAL